MKADHLAIVQQCHAQQPPTGTTASDTVGSATYQAALESCFHFEQRVLAALARQFPAERWGYLAKGGDNTLLFEGHVIKVGRLCGPDSQLYKILIDIPTTNAPVWNDEGLLTTDFPGSSPSDWYRPFEADVPIDPPTPAPDLVAALLALTRTVAALQAYVTANEELATVRHAELKRIALAPQHYEGTVKVPYLGTALVVLDRKPPA